MSKTEDKSKTETKPKAAPKAKVPVKTPLENAREVAASKILKLYAAMDEDTAYDDREVCEALGLKYTDVNVQAVALEWHKAFDEGKVGAPHYYKPPGSSSFKKRPLPRI